MILDWMGKEEKEETDRRHVDGLSSRNIGETMREMHCPMMSYWAKRRMNAVSAAKYGGRSFANSNPVAT